MTTRSCGSTCCSDGRRRTPSCRPSTTPSKEQIMAILLSKTYNGCAAGSVQEFTAELEAALIAQGFGTASVVTSITAGAQNYTLYSGTASVAIGAASVVITNPLIVVNTKV